MVTKTIALKIAREFVNALMESGVHLRKAILFGSFSRNEQRHWSDIDLALVADEFTGVGYFDLNYLLKIKVSDKKFTSIETHTFSTSYFEQGDPFIEEIIKTGIVLYPKKEKNRRKLILLDHL
jgi:predicted nucleotidyltransferase